MESPRTAQQNPFRGQVVIATIGLLGILVTAFLSNWEKLFPKQNVVQATFSGYRPTGDFETELRYYFEVSGFRTVTESMEHNLLQNFKANLISKNPKDAENINKIFDSAAKEAPRLEDVIRDLMPVYQKHFTINEIQELNRFYSTDVMQGMVRKIPLLTQDAAPIQVKLIEDYFTRLEERLNAELKSQPEKDNSALDQSAGSVLRNLAR